jgi:hypothetical protein
LRFGAAAVATLACAAVVLAAAILSRHQARWFDGASAPLAGTGLNRVTSRSAVAPELLPADGLPRPVDAHDAQIVDADGTPLVGEQLVHYLIDRVADLALFQALTRAQLTIQFETDGFRRIDVDCRVACRPGRIGRHGDLVILLVRPPVADASDATRADSVLNVVARQYGEHVGLDGQAAPPMPRPLKALLIAAGTALFFAPFTIWRADVARRAAHPAQSRRRRVSAGAATTNTDDGCAPGDHRGRANAEMFSRPPARPRRSGPSRGRSLRRP